MAPTLPAIGSRYFHHHTAMFAKVIAIRADQHHEYVVDLLFEDGWRPSFSLDTLHKNFDQIHQSSTGKVVLLEDERKSRDETTDQGEDE